MAERTPATRAIVEAFDDRYELCGPFDDNWQELCLAAALRAAAYQVAPARPQLDSCCEHWEQRIRHQFLAIATELEGHDG